MLNSGISNIKVFACNSNKTLANAIADKLGLKLEVVDMEFDSLIASVQSGKVDIVLAGMTVNEERKKNVDFTQMYSSSSPHPIP